MPRLKLVNCRPCRMWHPPDHCPNTVACPSCGQGPGHRCESPSGHKRFGVPHAGRLLAIGEPPHGWQGGKPPSQQAELF